jgi:hypothetical protein
MMKLTRRNISPAQNSIFATHEGLHYNALDGCLHLRKDTDGGGMRVMRRPKHALTVQLGFILLVTISPTTILASQNRPRQGGFGTSISAAEARDFGNFLNSHPNISHDLKSDPKIVDSREYLDSHPELVRFLSAHKNLWEALKRDPPAIMDRVKALDQTRENPSVEFGSHISRAELDDFKTFLDSNPNIAQDLKSRPKMVDSEKYLNSHPQLVKFLDGHKNFWEFLKRNPDAVMRQVRTPGRR